MRFKTHHVPRYVLYISFNPLRNPTKGGLFPETRSPGVRQPSTDVQLVAESESHLGFWPAQPIFPSASLAAVPTTTLQSLRVLAGPVLGWGHSTERGGPWCWVWPLPGAVLSGCLRSWVVTQPDPLSTYPRGCQTQRHDASRTPARLPVLLEPTSLPRPFSPVSIRPTYHQAQKDTNSRSPEAPFLHLSLSRTVAKLFGHRMKASKGLSLPSGSSQPGREDEPTKG